MVFDFVDNASQYNMPYSMHRLFRLKEYKPGALVLGTKQQKTAEQGLYDKGERPDALIDWPVDALDYELVDIFNWQEEAAGMISQMEFVRRVDVQTETIERYVREGLLVPDLVVPMSEHRTFKYFKEETLQRYAEQYRIDIPKHTGQQKRLGNKVFKVLLRDLKTLFKQGMVLPQILDLPAVWAVVDLRSGNQMLGGSCRRKYGRLAVCVVQNHRPPIFLFCLQQQWGNSTCHRPASSQDHFLIYNAFFSLYTEISRKGNCTLKTEYPSPKKILTGKYRQDVVIEGAIERTKVKQTPCASNKAAGQERVW